MGILEDRLEVVADWYNLILKYQRIRQTPATRRILDILVDHFNDAVLNAGFVGATQQDIDRVKEYIQIGLHSAF